jgi:hypothetical protein
VASDQELDAEGAGHLMASSRKKRRAWSVAFAKQAISDLDAREVLATGGASRCHQLHYLQMAAEKVCKAYLYDSGGGARESHAVVQKHLAVIARDLGSDRKLSNNQLKILKKLAAEIDKLAPALKGDGSRPDNVEYPWEDANGDIIAPVDHDFPGIEDWQLPRLLKLLRSAASQYAA